MRIGLCGLPNIGKTALANEIAQRLKLPTVTGIPSQVSWELGLTGDYTQPEELGTQDLMCYKKMVLEKLKEAEQQFPHGFVGARSSLECAAWWLTNIPASLYPIETEEYVYSCMKHAMDNYDVILYVPKETLIDKPSDRATVLFMCMGIQFIGKAVPVLRVSNDVSEIVDAVQKLEKCKREAEAAPITGVILQ